MTEKIYNAVWEYVTQHKKLCTECEPQATTMMDALIEEQIIDAPTEVATMREVYECIDAALRYGNIM